MSDGHETPFCTCGDSLYDHAIKPDQLPGQCFVGGCGCSAFRPDGADQRRPGQGFHYAPPEWAWLEVVRVEQQTRELLSAIRNTLNDGPHRSAEVLGVLDYLEKEGIGKMRFAITALHGDMPAQDAETP